MFNYGNKTAAHIAQQRPDPNNSYEIHLVRSAKIIVERQGLAEACSWKYLTQYTSGRCAWRHSEGQSIII